MHNLIHTFKGHTLHKLYKALPSPSYIYLYMCLCVCVFVVHIIAFKVSEMFSQTYYIRMFVQLLSKLLSKKLLESSDFLRANI